jgi:hypothetical protein
MVSGTEELSGMPYRRNLLVDAELGRLFLGIDVAVVTLIRAEVAYSGWE